MDQHTQLKTCHSWKHEAEVPRARRQINPGVHTVLRRLPSGVACQANGARSLSRLRPTRVRGRKEKETNGDRNRSEDGLDEGRPGETGRHRGGGAKAGSVARRAAHDNRVRTLRVSALPPPNPAAPDASLAARKARRTLVCGSPRCLCSDWDSAPLSSALTAPASSGQRLRSVLPAQRRATLAPSRCSHVRRRIRLSKSESAAESGRGVPTSRQPARTRQQTQRRRAGYVRYSVRVARAHAAAITSSAAAAQAVCVRQCRVPVTRWCCTQTEVT